MDFSVTYPVVLGDELGMKAPLQAVSILDTAHHQLSVPVVNRLLHSDASKCRAVIIR